MTDDDDDDSEEDDDDVCPLCGTELKATPPAWDAMEPMLGDRVFVLAMLVHGALAEFGSNLDASLDSALGTGKAWSILDFGQGRKYRVTIEDEPDERYLTYRDIQAVPIRRWDER